MEVPPDAPRSLSHADPAMHPRCSLPSGDESGAIAPVVDAGERQAAIREAVGVMAPQDALVVDAGFGVSLLQQEGVERYVVRVPKHFTARRATPDTATPTPEHHPQTLHSAA